MIHPLLRFGRILFVIEGCTHCSVWKSFIHRINLELPLNKRIKVIDCTKYHDLRYTDNPIINLFAPYIRGEYPVLFFEGRKKDGANTRIEAESWMKGKLQNDFLYPTYNPFMFNKQCEFGKKGIFRNKPICKSF